MANDKLFGALFLSTGFPWSFATVEDRDCFWIRGLSFPAPGPGPGNERPLIQKQSRSSTVANDHGKPVLRNNAPNNLSFAIHRTYDQSSIAKRNDECSSRIQTIHV